MTILSYIIFFIGFLKVSGACELTSSGIYTFGPSCQYMCHCLNGAEYDAVTGVCSNGCQSEWYGPGCQFRDQAYKKYARHNSNIEKFQYADRANDGDITTCSYTNNASLSTTSPWWRVWLPHNETIHELTILTNDDGKEYFTNFSVMVEYVPENQHTFNNYLPENSDTCNTSMQQENAAKSFNVLCEKPLVGNQIRIKLNQIKTQLVLCDVRVNGGRNIAFSRPIEVSSRNNPSKYGAEQITDGSLQNSDWDYCFVSDSNFSNWLRADLGQTMLVTYVNLTKYNDGRLRNYNIQTSNDDITWTSVYEDSSTVPNTQISLNVSTQYLRIIRPKERRFILCELQIFGGCMPNKCGYDCSKDCHCSALEHLENRINGKCSTGCKSGWTGINRACDTCEDGLWGPTCSNKCGSCLGGPCNTSDGQCKLGCKSGYKNTTLCTDACEEGKWGINCNKTCGICLTGVCNATDGKCKSGCASGYIDDHFCTTACDNGFWGHNCSATCGNCFDGPCDSVNGKCGTGCASGYKTTPLCKEECDNGTYGIQCNNNCSMNCEDVCSKTTGQCIACKPGWKGIFCDTECENGTYGLECNRTCNKHCDGICNKENGHCTTCLPGWTGTFCDAECENGTYGKQCNRTCSQYCDDVCDKTNGHCTSCSPGWNGTLCETECENGTYGILCNRSCSNHCDDVCDKTNGQCTTCLPGWNGTVCDTECPNGTYGHGCSGVCGYCKDSVPCDKINGSCSDGCDPGYEGRLCDTYIENLEKSLQTGNGDEEIVPVGVIGGGVSAVIVITIVAVVGFVVWRRKRSSSKTEEPSPSFDNVGLDAVTTTHEECNGNSDRLSTKKTETQDKDYYQFEKNRGISIEQLAGFVKTHLVKEGFFNQEFQKIPYGLQYATNDARQNYNAGKNRYKEMYAYDHSRVVLSTLPSNPHSDYINASYIKGYQKERAYIAAQGPTENNVADFWRMVWEKDVEIIAMVTKLKENITSKCIQYWATLENSKTYGDIAVSTETEEVFAEFELRRFKLSRQTKIKRVVQYTYTAWPDKDVPSSTSSLLHYWNKVRKNDENKIHPWLVHCSAGVGRTGTFIALDILYDQGVDTGYVDVEACVRNLREQRVNMVQKEGQYAFLYRAMVEALVLPSTPITVDQFHVWYADQLDIDRGSGKTKLMSEFETMVDDNIYVTSADKENHDDEEDGNVYQNSNQVDVNRAKNRYSNIIAADEFRPFLSSYVPGTTNYINAVYIPSYSDLHGYLITQTPLPDTAVDCCRLVIEQEIHVVVTFDDDSNTEVGIYLPPSGSVDIGPFNVTFKSEENKDGYTIRKYVMVYKSKEHTIIQFIYKKWPTNQLVPTEPNHVLEFLHRVDEHTRQFDNKPTMLLCLNGAERSGLFVVLINVIERARIDEEVSIPQIIRYLRTRRQQIVPNYEQYKFCHDVMLCYAESNTTYANV